MDTPYGQGCFLFVATCSGALLIEEAQMELDKKKDGQKYTYKVNVSLSLVGNLVVT
jgi:hypothetical protein